MCCGGLRGPTGPIGPTGPTGPIGPQGVAGFPGYYQAFGALNLNSLSGIGALSPSDWNSAATNAATYGVNALFPATGGELTELVLFVTGATPFVTPGSYAVDTEWTVRVNGVDTVGLLGVLPAGQSYLRVVGSQVFAPAAQPYVIQFKFQTTNPTGQNPGATNNRPQGWLRGTIL